MQRCLFLLHVVSLLLFQRRFFVLPLLFVIINECLDYSFNISIFVCVFKIIALQSRQLRCDTLKNNYMGQEGRDWKQELCPDHARISGKIMLFKKCCSDSLVTA